MIWAPKAALRFSKKVLSTDARIRGLAVVMTTLAVAVIALPLGGGTVAEVLRVVGWAWAAAALCGLASPGLFRRFTGGVIDYFESSVDEVVVRLIGILSVAIGVGLIYFGIYVA